MTAHTRHHTVASALALGLLLGGCTAGQPTDPSSPSQDAETASPSAEPTESESAGKQTVAEACEELGTGLQSAQTGLAENLSELQSDPAAGAAAIQELSTTLASAATAVTNTEVQPLADKADAALSRMSDALATVAADPAIADQVALLATVTDFQTAFVELAQSCSAADAPLG